VNTLESTSDNEEIYYKIFSNNIETKRCDNNTVLFKFKHLIRIWTFLSCDFLPYTGTYFEMFFKFSVLHKISALTIRCQFCCLCFLFFIQRERGYPIVQTDKTAIIGCFKKWKIKLINLCFDWKVSLARVLCQLLLIFQFDYSFIFVKIYQEAFHSTQ
jgi:hypothetical protein